MKSRQPFANTWTFAFRKDASISRTLINRVSTLERTLAGVEQDVFVVTTGEERSHDHFWRKAELLRRVCIGMCRYRIEGCRSVGFEITFEQTCAQ